MAIDPIEFQKLKAKATQVKTEIDRAQGMLLSMNQALKKEFDCDSIEEAEEKLKKMKADLEETESVYHAEMAKFKEMYGDLLG